MTTEQEMASIGKMVVERKQAETREAALEAELNRGADKLEAARKLIKLGLRNPVDSLADPAVDAAIEQLPTKENLKDLLADLRSQRETLTDLRTRAAKLGI